LNYIHGTLSSLFGKAQQIILYLDLSIHSHVFAFKFLSKEEKFPLYPYLSNSPHFKGLIINLSVEVIVLK
jgi:hypothetical protein